MSYDPLSNILTKKDPLFIAIMISSIPLSTSHELNHECYKFVLFTNDKVDGIMISQPFFPHIMFEEEEEEEKEEKEEGQESIR